MSKGEGMTKVVSCVNLKGGVGKTAIAVNFAAFCGRAGLRTLLIDLDPQTNATFSCISPQVWSDHRKKNGTVADLLGLRNGDHAEGNEVDPLTVIKRSVFKGVDLIPSDLNLFTIDLDLGPRAAREKILKRAIAGVMGQYDVIVCDCPPNLTLPTQNALAISTHYVVPVSPDFLSSLGIALLLKRVEKFGNDIEHEIAHLGIVLSRVGRKSAFRSQTTQDLRQEFGARVLNSELRERTAVAESTAKNVPIYEMPDRSAAKEFSAVSSELLLKLGLKK